MQLILYTNNSDNRALNKSLIEISTIDIKLKDETEIINPVAVISGSIPSAANYAHISALNRYYYITGQRILPGKILEVSLREDVLMSWRVFLIQKAQVIAERSTNVPNKKLPDSVPVLANRNVIYKKFKGASEGFGSQTISADSKCYCLTVLNGNVKLDPPAQLRLSIDILGFIYAEWDSVTGAGFYNVDIRLESEEEWSSVYKSLNATSLSIPSRGSGLNYVRVAPADGTGNITGNYATASILVG